MKRRAEYLVRKRDGRTEWLRATKLARSIQLATADATCGDGPSEDWWAMELTTTVLRGVRSKLGQGRLLTTGCLSDAVEQVFLATGFPQAAECYRRAGAEQRRRRQLLETRRLLDTATVAPDLGVIAGDGRAQEGPEPFGRG